MESNLSITAGVRYDYHGGLTEKYGNMFNFNPSLYSVTGNTTQGFDVSNAGFEIAHNNKYNPTPNVSDSTLNGRQWGISPRVGFAWSPAMNHGAIVFSGSGGLYYDRGELFSTSPNRPAAAMAVRLASPNPLPWPAMLWAPARRWRIRSAMLSTAKNAGRISSPVPIPAPSPGFAEPAEHHDRTKRGLRSKLRSLRQPRRLHGLHCQP